MIRPVHTILGLLVYFSKSPPGEFIFLLAHTCLKSDEKKYLMMKN